MIEPRELEAILHKAFPDASVLTLEDLTGTKDHYQLTLVTPAFEGVSRVAQHQAVYRALGDLMKGPVHALALTTSAPSAYKGKTL